MHVSPPCVQLRGPPAKQAFAADGTPTKALEGFCKKNGVVVADVRRGRGLFWILLMCKGFPTRLWVALINGVGAGGVAVSAGLDGTTQCYC